MPQVRFSWTSRLRYKFSIHRRFMHIKKTWLCWYSLWNGSLVTKLHAICHDVIHSVRLRRTCNIFWKAIDFHLGSERSPLIIIFLESMSLNDFSKWTLWEESFQTRGYQTNWDVLPCEQQGQKTELQWHLRVDTANMLISTRSILPLSFLCVLSTLTT